MAGVSYPGGLPHPPNVAFAKQLAGAAMGKTLDDSIEGRLEV